jgi:hypothetical protein
MSAEIRVFLNNRGYPLPAGSRVRDAVHAAVPELLAAAESGEAFVTDGRGLPLTLDSPLLAGAILRVTRSSRRGSAVRMEEDVDG